MQTVLLICAILITTAVLVGTVYFVLTMIQVRRTAKETENVARNITAAFPFLNVLFLGGSLFPLITKMLENLFSKKKKEEV